MEEEKKNAIDDMMRAYICFICVVFVVSYSLVTFGCADVIFLIYLYQRWVYPVDKKRVNEFGFGGEDDQALTAPTDSTLAQQTEEDKKTN